MSEPRPAAPPRCPWCGEDPPYVAYHDQEWGQPLHDEAKHFEFLLLETMQAGLSWRTILGKREGFRAAFDHFDWMKIARYDDRKIAELLENPGIIRNKAKILGAVKNAQAFGRIREEYGSFDAYIWSWTDGQPVINRWTSLSQLPVKTELSDRVSADMKARGFAYVGSTTIYAHLQAIGVINDHLMGCFRWAELGGRHSSS